MELVHDDVVDFSLITIAQRDISKDFGGAAKDGCAAVDGGVASHHADIFGAEVAAEREELFVDQRLNRTGIDRLATL